MATATKAKKQMTISVMIGAALCQAYWIATQKLKLLPLVRKKVQNERLADYIDRHIEESVQQVKRLESAFDSQGDPAKRKPSAFINPAAIKDDSVLKIAERNLRDAAIIAALQQLAHAEIAVYASIAIWCDLEGLDEVSDLLKESLNESKTWDEVLTETAESEIQLGFTAEED